MWSVGDASYTNREAMSFAACGFAGKGETMTEVEWLASDARPLAQWVRAWTPPRKYHLLNCACCRLLAPWFVNYRLADCVDRAERYADGALTEQTFAKWGKLADELGRSAYGRPAVARVGEAVRGLFSYRLVSYPATWDAWRVFCVDQTMYDEPFCSEAPEVVRGMLRDIFGNPFRPVACDPAWRTDTAMSLARGMYESREFSAMPILADALQDAGCDNDDVLNHCRDAKQVHVRGCWVVDLVLGKE